MLFVECDTRDLSAPKAQEQGHFYLQLPTLSPLFLFSIFHQKKTWKRGFCPETQSYSGFVDPRLYSRFSFTRGEIPGCSMA